MWIELQDLVNIHMETTWCGQSRWSPNGLRFEEIGGSDGTSEGLQDEEHRVIAVIKEVNYISGV